MFDARFFAFVALSALLVWIVGQGERHPVRAGIAALAVGLSMPPKQPTVLVLPAPNGRSEPNCPWWDAPWSSRAIYCVPKPLN